MVIFDLKERTNQVPELEACPRKGYWLLEKLRYFIFAKWLLRILISSGIFQKKILNLFLLADRFPSSIWYWHIKSLRISLSGVQRFASEFVFRYYFLLKFSQSLWLFKQLIQLTCYCSYDVTLVLYYSNYFLQYIRDYFLNFTPIEYIFLLWLKSRPSPKLSIDTFFLAANGFANLNRILICIPLANALSIYSSAIAYLRLMLLFYSVMGHFSSLEINLSLFLLGSFQNRWSFFPFDLIR